MKLRPAQRREALAKMGNGYQKQMFLLGLRLQAAAREPMTAEQQRRIQSELQPAVERIKANQTRANQRGLLALQVQRATSIFYDIMGDDWHPRPDNPVQRECMADLQTSF
ncbi:hypothetical protein [Gordonia sp. WA4-43]|uniref:hypothetical protein n=1 Tax=Gordonia sp. WA4-43 TaxID=2878678 RepID=UPI001CFB8305|nr:hypothetical protein [Gordonia sp. WA4-43]UCZ89053.1 hypothetical protein LEL84_18640 [Gordonia sp. WA4-43]